MEHDFSDKVGIQSDINTRNIVFQIMDYDDLRETPTNFSARTSVTLDDQLGEDIEFEKNTIESKGKAFLHSKEYYAIIKDEEQRMKAYRGIEVSSSIPTGEEAEIEQNPFKFLHLPEDCTFAQVRSAYITLSRMWFPDFIHPENAKQYNMIFGDYNNAVKGIDYSDWFKRFKNSPKPITLESSEIAELKPDEQKTYFLGKEKYAVIEHEYELIKSAMRLRANEVMSRLNSAYTAAKSRFSDTVVKSFAGFEWEKGKKRSANYLFELIEGFLDIDDATTSYFEYLALEGAGEIRIDEGKLIHDDIAYLAYDHGHVYWSDHDYRQRLNLRSLFAWMEIKNGEELSPTLLDDMKQVYDMNDSDAEALRIMIMNKEEPDFISTTLGIKDNRQLMQFLNFLQNGPCFYFHIYPRESQYYPLGVEFNSQGNLILRYMSQEEQGYDQCHEGSAFFTKTDVQVMQAIAYGPLLQENVLVT